MAAARIRSAVRVSGFDHPTAIDNTIRTLLGGGPAAADFSQALVSQPFDRVSAPEYAQRRPVLGVAR